MTDVKETRAHTFEIKFVVDAQMGERIRAWARTFLDADRHGTGPFGDEYRTSTLYFDTAEGHVFHRWGSYGRAKYRIRRYGDSDARKWRSTTWNDGRMPTPRLGRRLNGFGAERTSARSEPFAKSRTIAQHAPLTTAWDWPGLRSTSRFVWPLSPEPGSVPIREKSLSRTSFSN